MENFADTLTRRTRELETPLCVGLDPYVELIPRRFKGKSAAATVLEFFSEVLPLLSGRVAVVKPQIALFERMGIPGLEALQQLVAMARSLGLLVLLDAKRGDIGETAQGYAEAYLSGNGFLDVDAVTVNPYMGLDSVAPFVELAETNGKGVVVLVRNSNPGSDVLQLLETPGGRLFEAVADSLKSFEARLLGASGWSSLGVTVSARSPEDSLRVRERLPRSLFLVLGYGAQGGTAGSAVAGLTPRDGKLEGGVVNSSRAVLYPDDLDAFSSWESAMEATLTRAITGLKVAIQ
jgi:orotidine-5'-phosphate decarboxylase